MDIITETPVACNQFLLTLLALGFHDVIVCFSFFFFFFSKCCCCCCCVFTVLQPAHSSLKKGVFVFRNKIRKVSFS